MISIVNVGPITNDVGGERNYEVHIDEDLICTFKHTRSDGLAICLSRASKAVHAKNIDEKKRLSDLFKKMNKGIEGVE